MVSTKSVKRSRTWSEVWSHIDANTFEGGIAEIHLHDVTELLAIEEKNTSHLRGTIWGFTGGVPLLSDLKLYIKPRWKTSNLLHANALHAGPTATGFLVIETDEGFVIKFSLAQNVCCWLYPRDRRLTETPLKTQSFDEFLESFCDKRQEPLQR